MSVGNFIEQNGIFEKFQGVFDGLTDALAKFSGTQWGKEVVKNSQIKKKVLELALPDGDYTLEMVKTIKEAVKYAEKNGIEMNVRIVK